MAGEFTSKKTVPDIMSSCNKGVASQTRTGKIRKSLPHPLSNNQKGYGFYYNHEAFDGAVYFAVRLKVVP
ncbi:MAG TPA: hypothetical protein VF487_06795 [Chitinophagaceae bacterium]